MFCYLMISLVLQLSTCNPVRNFFAGRLNGFGLVPPPPEEAIRSAIGTVEIKNFTQLLDHFNSSCNATWHQRYQVNEALRRKGGPIFVMIGGEGSIDASWLVYGQMYQQAKRHGALLFQLEHRFYGKSHPTKDASIEHLRYLSTTQALADLDRFIAGMKDLYQLPRAKVVVFGGSYAGDLVIWFRSFYPHSTVGGVASSPPVLAQEDFIEYMETVGNAEKYFDPKCYEAVEESFKKIQELVANQDDEQLEALFGICDKKKLNYTDSYEIQTFYSQLIFGWGIATQYNNVGNNSQVAYYCRIMTNPEYGDPINRYAKFYTLASAGGCVSPDYKSFIEEIKKESWDSDFVAGGSRQWLWQTCNEFGYYMTTDSKNQPFGVGTVTLKYYEDLWCTQPFGISPQEIAKNVAATNERYGGKEPKARNVFLFNGSIDQWHTLSVFDHDLNWSSPSRFIEGTSHCYDMFEARPDDPPKLTKSRREMARRLSVWLA